MTTVISASLGWNKGALMHWAWSQGRDGLDYRVTKDAAAEAGTLAHALVEDHLKKGTTLHTMPAGVDPEVEKRARLAYEAFLEFESAVGLQTLAVECPLVSETHQYGGTIDIASVKHKRAILDIKTSKDVYPDQWIQLAAYGKLWEEHHPGEPIEAYYILKLGKEDGSFTYYYKPSLEKEWEAFLLLRKLYDLKKTLE